MQIILSTNNEKLQNAVARTAAELSAVICQPENMLDMLFSDASVLIIDPNTIRRDVWEAYLDYQQSNAGDDYTMLILLLPTEWSVRVKTPCELNAKPDGKLYHCYPDDIESITTLIKASIASPAVV